MIENSWLKWQRDKTHLVAFAGALTLGAANELPDSEHHPGQFEVSVGEPLPMLDQPDFFEHVHDGKYSVEEKEAGKDILGSGVEIFRDVGISFYKVQPGDKTVQQIKDKLSQHNEFAYIKKISRKLLSFNINDNELAPGMWIPIPPEKGAFKVSDDQFARFANQAIDNLEQNKQYGPTIRELKRIVSKDKLIASLAAVSWQESKRGELSSPLYDRKRHDFSYSMMHIFVNDGPGLFALDHLGLTEGQIYHPQNADELFLGFLVEKQLERPKNIQLDLTSILPFDSQEKADNFATIYNGSAWTTKNPDYSKNIREYYRGYLNFIHTHPSPP